VRKKNRMAKKLKMPLRTRYRCLSSCNHVLTTELSNLLLSRVTQTQVSRQ